MNGLSAAEAAERLARLGPNALPAPHPVPLWRRVVWQFESPLIYVLVIALAFDLGLWFFEGADGWPLEATAIGLILALNAAFGLYQEQRSDAALSRLKDLAGAHAWALRDGQLVRVPTEALVPGDWVRLEAGDRIPADGTLTEAHGVMLDESILTGESVPIDKSSGAEAFSGTLLVRGTTFVRITRTGATSAMGRLATMLGEIESTKTPLELRVEQLGRQIAKGVLILAGALTVVGVVAEGLHRSAEIVVFAIALAVAAVPEGLPAVLTIALALGVERMASRRAVVRRLSAVETLGSVSVIATDKTGTLTENRMDVQTLDVSDLPRALNAIALANAADLSLGAGDPLDLGLLRHASEHGVNIRQLREAHPAVSSRPFDAAWKFMRVSVRDQGEIVSYVKGAPEVVAARCSISATDRESLRIKAEAYAREGYRVLAIAWGHGEAEEGLTFIGLALFRDPPRAEVQDAVRRALVAGIRVVMITGDHPETALAIAHQIGIPGVRMLTGENIQEYESRALRDALASVNVFARISPAQKLRIVEALQAEGRIVAMTGDGVNDAPALKRSDIGVAMGKRGSDVSREVSDIVLLDDNFATIVRAVQEGRGIYENIQKILRFLFSTNLSEVLLVAAGSVFAFSLNLRSESGGLLLPLTAVQILWINLMTDSLPAMALALDRTPDVMRRPPRPPNSPLLDKPSLRFIAGVAVMMAVLALSMLRLVPRLGYDLDMARAVTFHFMAIGQLFMTYPSRHTWVRPLPNRYLHAAVATSVGIQFAAGSFEFSRNLFGHAPMPPELWALVMSGAVVAWAFAETLARVVWRRSGAAYDFANAAGR